MQFPGYTYVHIQEATVSMQDFYRVVLVLLLSLERSQCWGIYWWRIYLFLENNFTGKKTNKPAHVNLYILIRKIWKSWAQSSCRWINIRVHPQETVTLQLLRSRSEFWTWTRRWWRDLVSLWGCTSSESLRTADRVMDQQR